MISPAAYVPALFVVLWATGFIGARYAMPWAEPFSFLAVRFGLTMLIIGAIGLAMGARRADARGAAHAVLAGALMHGVYLGGTFWAIRHGMTAGFSALIVGLQPLITALVAGVALRDRIDPRNWLGLGLGFVGVVVVIWPKLGAAAEALTPAALSAMVLGVVAMSAGTIWQKRFVGGLDLVTGSFWQYVGATALMAAMSFMLETREFVLTGELVFALVWLVFVLSIGAIFLLMYLIREGSVAKVSSLFYLVPAVTALMAWPLFGETLTIVQIAGMAIASAGVALATSTRNA
jgi:drug/metabolite transporter (DMT)-like permease